MSENGAASSGGHRRRLPNFFARYEVFSASHSPQLTPSSHSPSSRSPASSQANVDSGLPTLVNPFARREEFSSQHLLLYKITTLVTYLLLLVTAFYYTFNAPRDGKKHHGKWDHQSTIWGQNDLHPTPYSQNFIITSIYWYVFHFLPQLDALNQC